MATASARADGAVLSPWARGTPARESNGAPMDVLLVSSDTFPPTRVDVAVLFGDELASRGHRIDVILQSESACRRPYVTTWSGGQAWVGATDLGHTLFARVHKHLLGIREDLRLFSRLRTGPYQLLVVKDKFISGLLGLLAAAWYKRPFAYWLSYPIAESYLERARDGTGRYPLLYLLRGTIFKLLLYRVLLPRADHVFVQSEQMRRDVEGHGIEPAKIKAVPMGVQPQMFPESALGEHTADVEHPRILYLGSLGRDRRLDFLLRVLLRVRSVLGGARLILVGRADEPSEERLLLEEIERLGLHEAVELTGQLPRARALELVAQADVCVSPIRPSPSLNPASPTKLIEYMAMGKAVVANEHPEQRLLIEQSGAGLCVAYEEEAFADAIVTVLLDPQAACAMGRRGRRYVLEHRSYAIIAGIVERDMLRLAARTSAEPAG